MLVCFWSPKGGSGTSVVAAGAAIVLAREGVVCLADLHGDQPAVLGLAHDPVTGLRDWMRVGVDAPVDALARFAVDAAPGLTLLGAGRGPVDDLAPEVGAALGVALRDGPDVTVVDVGVPAGAAQEALLAVADVTIVVLRPCYLALRRAVRCEALTRTAGAVVVEEADRSLRGREISDVLRVPVVATIDVRASVARSVDAGVFLSRPPDHVVRPVRSALRRLGVSGREGRAA